MSLLEKPLSVQRQEIKDRLIKLFSDNRASGKTLGDTAYETTDLYFELSTDLRQENERLGKEIKRLNIEIKNIKSQCRLL